MTNDEYEIIEVRINSANFPQDWNFSLYESWVLQQLIDAGIPMKGQLRSRGVERGKLERIKDFGTGDLIYRWSDDRHNTS